MALDPPLTPTKGVAERPPGTISPDSTFQPEALRASSARAAGTRRIDRARIPATVVQALPGSARGLEGWLRKPLPWIGRRPVQQQVQVLGILMALFVVFTVSVIYVDASISARAAQHLARTSDMQVQSQRLARVAPACLLGLADAFKDLVDSRDQIDLDLIALASGDPASGVTAASQDLQPLAPQLPDKWKTTQTAGARIVTHRTIPSRIA